MAVETLAPYLVGPGAGLAVCILVGLGVYKLLVAKVFPLVEGAVNRHLDQIDRIVEQHSAEHEAIIEALRDLKPCVCDEAAK